MINISSGSWPEQGGVIQITIHLHGLIHEGDGRRDQNPVAPPAVMLYTPGRVFDMSIWVKCLACRAGVRCGGICRRVTRAVHETVVKKRCQSLRLAPIRAVASGRRRDSLRVTAKRSARGEGGRR